MHQTVEDGGGHGVVSEVLAPVLHDPVGGHDDAALELVALVHQRLQQLATSVADAAGQEQIVQHQQIGVEQHAYLLPLLGGVAQRVLAERAVSLQVAHVVALQRGVVGQRLGDVAFAGAGRSSDILLRNSR